MVFAWTPPLVLLNAIELKLVEEASPMRRNAKPSFSQKACTSRLIRSASPSMGS
jgi:hypothetical protein